MISESPFGYCSGWHPGFRDSSGDPIFVCSHRGDLWTAQRCAQSRRGRSDASGCIRCLLCCLRTGNLWLGVTGCHDCWCSHGTCHGLCDHQLNAEQGISGIGFYLFGLGMSDLLFQKLVGTVETVKGFPPIYIPVLSDIPDHWKNFLQSKYYGLWRVSARAHCIVYSQQDDTWFEESALSARTRMRPIRWASAWRAPAISRSSLGGILSAIAGASLSIALLDVFQQNMTSGMGFIAVALVYFGAWRPLGVLGGALLFSMVMSLQLWVQVMGGDIPSDIAVMMPYILTILVLVATASKVRAPSALTKPFEREN